MGLRRCLPTALLVACLLGCSDDTSPTPAPTPPPGDAAACAQVEQLRAEAASVEAELAALQGAGSSATAPPDPALENRRQALVTRLSQLRAQEPTLSQQCGR